MGKPVVVDQLVGHHLGQGRTQVGRDLEACTSGSRAISQGEDQVDGMEACKGRGDLSTKDSPGGPCTLGGDHPSSDGPDGLNPNPVYSLIPAVVSRPSLIEAVHTVIAMTSIPSPRLVLTDVINQLSVLHGESSGSPTAPATPKFHGSNPESTPNPLKTLPEAAQELVIALDYLLPTGISPALDLLDRGLVTRYSLKVEEAVVEPDPRTNCTEPNDEDAMSEEPISRPKDKGKQPEELDTPAIPTRNLSSYVYHVQSGRSRPRKYPKYKKFFPRIYCVRTKAWHCSCDAFTHAAFVDEPKPVSIGGVKSGIGARRARRLWKKEEEEKIWQQMNKYKWVWGGRMLGVGSPPVCIHLVACVLAEHCGELFMPYIKEEFLTLDGLLELGINRRLRPRD